MPAPKTGAVRRSAQMLLAIQGAAVLAIFLAAIAYLDVHSTLAALALGLACVLLLRMLIISNNFLLSFWYRSPTPHPHRLRLHALPRLFLFEYLTSLLSSSWTMAFHVFDKRVFPDSTSLPVLLVHGYGCNSGYWHGMSRAFSRERITHYAIDLEPVFAEIDSFVPMLDRAIERILRETGAPRVILVGHSMGGLVARAWLLQHGPARVARIITLGTPHQGTGLAKFGIGPSSRQMHWHGRGERGVPSDWLRQLAEREDPANRRLFTSIYSHHDNIVSPQESSRLPGASNIELGGIGHVSLGYSHTVQDLVVQEVKAASAGADRD